MVAAGRNKPSVDAMARLEPTNDYDADDGSGTGPLFLTQRQPHVIRPHKTMFQPWMIGFAHPTPMKEGQGQVSGRSRFVISTTRSS